MINTRRTTTLGAACISVAALAAALVSAVDSNVASPLVGDESIAAPPTRGDATQTQGDASPNDGAPFTLEFLTVSYGGSAPDDGTLWVAGRHIVGVVSNANHTFEFGPLPPMLSASTGNGDGDGDNDVDVIDFAGFQVCFTGSDVPFIDPSCWIFDMNRDRHVDLSDFKLFQLAHTGAGG